MDLVSHPNRSNAKVEDTATIIHPNRKGPEEGMTNRRQKTKMQRGVK